jgi:hypothetical protein
MAYPKQKKANIDLLETVELSIVKPKGHKKLLEQLGYALGDEGIENFVRDSYNNFNLHIEDFENYKLYSLVNGSEKIPINYYHLNELIHIENDDGTFVSVCLKKPNGTLRSEKEIIENLKRVFKII